MKKIWQVLKYEYLNHVLKRRFLFTVFSMPFFLLIMGITASIVIWAEYNGDPIGYVDKSGLLNGKTNLVHDEGRLFTAVEIKAYQTEKEAQRDLQNNEIQAYFVVSADYYETGQVELVSLESSGEHVRDQFRDFLRGHLLANQPEAVAKRIMWGSDITVRSLENDRLMEEGQWLRIVIPVLSGILFMIVINISSGYLLQALVDEKENRTIEIMITSVSPGQLMTGKIIGNLGVGLTVLVFWIIMAVVGIMLLSEYVFPGQKLGFDWSYLIVLFLTLLPAFIMISALMAAVGSTTTDSREAQQIAGIFTLPMIMPYWFAGQIIMNPDSLFSIVLSLFPLTAPVSLPLRAAFSEIPLWQMISSIGLLFAGAVFSLWLAGKAVRMGMLKYGKRLPFRELFKGVLVK